MREPYIKLCKELSDALVRGDLMQETVIEVIKKFMLELHEDISKGLTKKDFDLIVQELLKNFKTALKISKVTRFIRELELRHELEHEKRNHAKDDDIVIHIILLERFEQIIDAAKKSFRMAKLKNEDDDIDLRYENHDTDNALLKFNKKLASRKSLTKEPPETLEIFLQHPFNDWNLGNTDFKYHLLYACICMSEYGKILPRPDFEINEIQKYISNFNREKVGEFSSKYFRAQSDRYVGLLLQCIENDYDKISDYQNIYLLKDPTPEDTDLDSCDEVSRLSSEIYFSKLIKILSHLSMMGNKSEDQRCEFVLQLCISELEIATPTINNLHSFISILKAWGLYSQHQVVVEKAIKKNKIQIVQDELNDELNILLDKIKKNLISCEHFFAELEYKETNIQLLLSAVISTPAMLSKFIDYYFQGNNIGSEEKARFENVLYRELNLPKVMQELSFEDRKKVVASRWFLPNNVQVIFKLFSGLEKAQAQELFMLIERNRILERDRYEEYVEEYYYPGCHKDMRIAFKFAYANSTSRFSPVNIDEFKALSHSIGSSEVFSPERMPLALLVIIANSSTFNQKAFSEFVVRFDKANKHAEKHSTAGEPERHVIDYKDFMTNNINKLANLHQLIGDNLFRFMASKCATSNLNLDRFFKTFKCIPVNYFSLVNDLNNYLSKPANKSLLFTPISQASNQDYNDLGNILLYIGHFESLKSDLPTEYVDDVDKKISAWRQQVGQRDFSLKILLKVMSEDLVEIYIKALKPPRGIELDKSKLHLSPELVGRLIVGRNAMKKSAFAEVYDRLVIEDLKAGGSFQKFSMDTQQEAGSLGCLLAEHNARIVHDLQKNSINPELAMNYDRFTEFNTRMPDEKNVSLVCKEIWADLENVKKELVDDTSQEGRPIVKCIEDIRKQVVKGTKEKPKINTDVISGQPMKGTITRLHKLTFDLVNKVSSDHPVKKYGEDFLIHVEQLEAANKEDLTQSIKIPEKDFRIKQWDKQNIETFILGDYLSCCLAPDGSEFPAIVQRRLDAAMMMHVVMDKELNEPVCGNWLFMGYDTENPNDVYVVANYHEIRAGLGAKPELRDKLVEELTKFTAEYAENIGAKGYLLSPLSYGKIPDFKGKYESKEIRVAKVGGFFNPKASSNEDIDFSYYLKSTILDFEFYIAPTKSPTLSSDNANFKKGL